MKWLSKTLQRNSHCIWLKVSDLVNSHNEMKIKMNEWQAGEQVDTHPERKREREWGHWIRPEYCIQLEEQLVELVIELLLTRIFVWNWMLTQCRDFLFVVAAAASVVAVVVCMFLLMFYSFVRWFVCFLFSLGHPKWIYYTKQSNNTMRSVLKRSSYSKIGTILSTSVCI